MDFSFSAQLRSLRQFFGFQTGTLLEFCADADVPQEKELGEDEGVRAVGTEAVEAEGEHTPEVGAVGTGGIEAEGENTLED
ncbi:hypothetical protein Acr_04g0005220 [Actinidia rufa]|uniref:Uncharacterized protein n=1 Tax=Actinidia rufa TaxID=165716 RepID=A0A7J0EH25_9ERIC|nr:hypothetical protein Acr_04g0005220 [Actinidia rufa]